MHVNQCQVEEVVGHAEQSDVAFCQRSKPLQKAVSGWHGEIEFEVTQDFKLLVEQLISGVGVVSDAAVAFSLWRVDLFVLAGYEQRGDTDKLKFGARHLPHRAVAVNVVYRQENRLLAKTVLAAYFDEPVDQYSSHFRSNLPLPREAMLVGVEASGLALAREADLLLHLHGALALLHILGHVLRVSNILEIELMPELISGWQLIEPVGLAHLLSAANFVHEGLELGYFLSIGLDLRQFCLD